MERVRQKKSKVPTVTEGNREISRQRRTSNSSRFSSGTTEEDLFTSELGRGSFRRVTGTPIKKLLAEEMSKETESKRRSPSVIARLMGLDGLPPQQPLHKQHKGFSGIYQQTASVASQRDGKPYEQQSTRKNSIEQEKFKDVYEVSETLKVDRGSHRAKGTVSSKLSQAEMTFIRQKFIDGKCLSTDENPHNAKEFCDTVDTLDTNKDLLMKFLQQPDSLFTKHLIDLQVPAPGTQCSRIAVMKPSNSQKYESDTMGWNSEKETLRCDTLSRKHHDVSQWKYHDGLSVHCNHRGAQKTLMSSRIQLDGKNESDILPIRIVVLKLNVEKAQNAAISVSSPCSATKSASSPCSSHANLSDCGKNTEYHSAGAVEARPRVKKNLSNDASYSRPKSRESKQRAKEIARRMTESFRGDLIDLSSTVKGYAGDESSYTMSGSDSGSESEVTICTSRKSFHWSNRQKLSSSHSVESSVSREAKKRLSERWKMSRRYQDVEAVGKGSTLGEMLATPDWEIWPENLLAMDLDGSSDRFASNDGITEWESPLGISSRDGWKKESARNSPGPRSVPALSVGYVGPNTHTQHEIVDQESYLITGQDMKQSRNKAFEGISNTRKVTSFRNLRSHNKKSQSPRHGYSDHSDSLEEKQFNQTPMKINLGKKDSSEQEPLISEMPANNVSSRSSIIDAEADAEHKDMIMSSESPDELLPKSSACLLGYNNSASPVPEDLKAQEPQIGPSDEDSLQLQCPLPEPQSPASSKEADHSSPVSVLEAPFTEEISSGTECFESVSAGLQELRMQLKLLKMESACDPDGMLMSSDKNVSQRFAAVPQQKGIVDDESCEASYLADVLIYSEVDDANPEMFMSKWHSPECPLGPSLFENLEQQYCCVNAWSRSDRRLLFDRINSGLIEIFEGFADPHPWLKPVMRKVGPKWQKRGVKYELQKWLATEERRANGYVTESVLDREMQWLYSGSEVDAIGRDLEKLLIDDLIAEVSKM